MRLRIKVGLNQSRTWSTRQNWGSQPYTWPPTQESGGSFDPPDPPGSPPLCTLCGPERRKWPGFVDAGRKRSLQDASSHLAKVSLCWLSTNIKTGLETTQHPSPMSLYWYGCMPHISTIPSTNFVIDRRILIWSKWSTYLWSMALCAILSPTLFRSSRIPIAFILPENVHSYNVICANNCSMFTAILQLIGNLCDIMHARSTSTMHEQCE